jgi:hypothetical protein
MGFGQFLRRVADLPYDRMLFSHGDELSAPFEELRLMLGTA